MEQRRFVRVCGGLAAVVALTGLGACSSSPPAPAPAPASSSTTSSGTTPATTSSAPTTRTTTTATPAGTAACTAANGKATVSPAAGGASAGHTAFDVVVTNTSSSPCTVKGYPGISLVAGTEGAQLGAAAKRTPGPEGTVTLAAGAKAKAVVQLAQASNFPDCGVTPAAGFRVYLPDDKAAQFAPSTQQGCSNAAVVVLEVAPFTT